MNRITLVFLLLSSFELHAAIHYLDPVNGSVNGTGTLNSPYGSLESVVKANLISSQQWQRPFTNPGKLIAKNPDSPIKAGDTLILLSGFHGNVELKGFINSDFITIESATNHNATLGNISFKASAKWRVQNLLISPSFSPNYDYSTNKIPTIVNIVSDKVLGPSSQIEIIDNEIFTVKDIASWTAEDWTAKALNGIFINAEYVRVSNNLVQNIKFGISVPGNNATVQGNQIINFSADAMRGNGDDGLFEYNIIANGFKVDGNHDDGFQSFTNNRGFKSISRVTLRSNQFFYDLNHPNKKLISNFQGIGCFDGFFNNWVIENNLLYINHWHGITLSGANHSRIVNNTVIDAVPEDKVQPWIRISPRKKSLGGGSGVGNITRNNIARIRNHGPGISEDHNIDPNQYDLNTLFIAPLNKNFNLRYSSIVIDSGSNKQSPDKDITGFDRSNTPDLGAFEYRTESSKR